VQRKNPKGKIKGNPSTGAGNSGKRRNTDRTINN